MVSSNQESQADSTDRYYLQEATSAPNGKSLIKLKIPKSNQGIEEDEIARSQVVPQDLGTSQTASLHYCADCNKSFSSGKALGGHMSSAHVQAGKDYQSKKLRLKNSTKFKQQRGYPPGAHKEIGDGAKKIVCKICGKDFPSRKSLYGHMRCHPDRKYRGMQPPMANNKTHTSTPSDHVDDESVWEEVMKSWKDGRPTGETGHSLSSSAARPAEEEEEEEDDEEFPDQFYDSTHPVRTGAPVVDLTKFLTSWTVTGERGRGDKGFDFAWRSSLSSTEVEELSEAAYSLVSLSNGTFTSSKQDEDMSREEDEGEDRGEDKPKEDKEDMSSKSITPGSEIEVQGVKQIRMGEKQQVYPVKDAHLVPIIGGTKPSPDADYYEDVNGASKSKRHIIEGSPSRDERQSPAKKLKVIGERKRETQIPHLPTYKGKGKTPIETKFHESPDAIYESGDESEGEDFIKGSEYINKSFADDSDREKTPEQQNWKYLQYRKKNGFVAYNKRFEKDEGNEKPLSTGTETNLSPVAEKKNAMAESTPEKYKCSTCNKCFATHQALGGHRSSHNKLRVSIQNTIDDSSPENQSKSVYPILESKEGSTAGLKFADNPHPCQICNKTFSSGRALGGHMRCHATGPSSQAASPEEDIQSMQNGLKFDLNEMPDMEDLDDKDGGN